MAIAEIAATCIHRQAPVGDPVIRQVCPDQGAPESVFGCALHGRCTVAEWRLGHESEDHVCLICPDRSNQPQVPEVAAAAESLSASTARWLENFFDRVIVVNLRRRPERRRAFFDELSTKGWPFREPEIFEAIDGHVVPVPSKWTAGGGTWGCMQSHRQILERAIQDEVKHLLVLEDDLVLRPGFRSHVAAFLAKVPGDWDQLMLGGQHLSGRRPETVRPGVVRCWNCQRTHAYAVRGKFLRDLYQHWISSVGHCDHRMGEIQGRYKVYAPDPFLCGQDRSQSDINGRVNPRKFWQAPAEDQPVVVLDAPPAVVKQLRRRGFHTGYTRDRETGIDVGLQGVFNLPEGGRELSLRNWLSTIQWEVASMDAAVCTVWHPSATVALVKQAAKSPVYAARGGTVEEVLASLPTELAELVAANASRPCVVLLRVPRHVVGELRAHGFHTGNWRHGCSDVDNGLLRIYGQVRAEDRPAELLKWYELLQDEADAIRDGVVTLWHPEAKADDLRGVFSPIGVDVVEITSNDAADALRQWQAHRDGKGA